MGKLANDMLRVQAKDMLQGVTTIQNGHATTNDVMMVSHISHAITTEELGKTARSGYRTIDHLSGVDNGSKNTKYIIGGLVITVLGIIGYLVWSKRKKQVTNVQTTQNNNQAIQNNNQQQEVKALPAGQTLGSFNWAGFRHDVLNTMAANTKELLDYAIQQARQVVKEK